MKHLYIIGNGFDKHHDIPCSYLDYYHWLETKKIDELERFQDFFQNLHQKENWSNFEEELGHVDVYGIADEIARGIVPDFSSEDSISKIRYRAESEAVLNADYASRIVCDCVRETFSDWIDALPSGKMNRKIRLEKKDSYFINFNYTLTLEELYGVPESSVLHIHGKRGLENYVLGHGKSEKDFLYELEPPTPDPPQDLDPEELQGWYNSQYNPFSESAVQATVAQLVGLKKDVTGIIAENQQVFKTFGDVEFIHIYGFSFSPIDLPYLEALIEEIDVSTVKWEISYYTDSDKERATSFILRSGIPRANYTLVKLDFLMQINENKQLELDFE